jgi:hypothetical protein
VEPTLIVAGDVNFASGNIDFPGDVIVRGDVKGGFRVRAGGKVEVHGMVEDAVIKANGDVLVKGGFEGSGRGLIHAGGAAHLKFIENQVLEAGGSIRLGESALNARIVSGDCVYLETGAGAVIGGRLQARRGISVRVLGNPGFAHTVVEVLHEDETDQEIHRQRQALERLNIEIANLERSLALLNVLELTQNESQRLRERQRLLRHQEALNSRLETDSRTLRNLINQHQADLSGKVMVHHRIYPGVRIIIAGMKLTVRETCGRTVLRRHGLEVVAEPLHAPGEVPPDAVVEDCA